MSSSDRASSLISVENAQDVEISNLTCDGRNLSDNCVLVRNSADVLVTSLDVSDARLNGIALLGRSTNVEIDSCVVNGNGEPLPSSAGSGIAIAPGADGVDGIDIHDCYVFGNNQGIAVFNSRGTQVVRQVRIHSNAIYSNANDGIVINSAEQEGGLIVRPLLLGNVTKCNGWTGTPVTKCPRGGLQRGDVRSSAGAGIDVIGGLVVEPLLVDNVSSLNYFDGISTDARRFTVVAVQGRMLKRLSGRPFDPTWNPGRALRLDDKLVRVATVVDIDTMKLESSVRDTPSAKLTSPSSMRATIIGNVLEQNGSEGVGAGVWNDAADDNLYRANRSTNNNMDGYGCNFAARLRYDHDFASMNQRSATRDAELMFQACEDIEVVDVTVHARTARFDVQFDPATQRGHVRGVGGQLKVHDLSTSLNRP